MTTFNLCFKFQGFERMRFFPGKGHTAHKNLWYETLVIAVYESTHMFQLYLIRNKIMA